VNALIVGDPADLHVSAVVESMRALGADLPMVVDAPSLKDQGFSLTSAHLESGGSRTSMSEGGTGWLRRYAPAAWGRGLVAGSLDAAVHRSFLTLIGSIVRCGSRRWLTTLDDMLRAEDRLLQLRTAELLAISIPQTVVSSEAEQVLDELSSPFVVKPLSLGIYWSPDGPRGVYTTALDTSALEIDFGGVPFMAQELIRAERHYRIVTVRNMAWVCELSADDRPLDWRQQPDAHQEWSETEDPKCAQQAVQLAQELGVGYSSQDWLVRGADRVFIDLNPGGQWLFLPKGVASQVTLEIARFLVMHS
jgi:hypothetical protein